MNRKTIDHLILCLGFILLAGVCAAGCSSEIPPGETSGAPSATVKAVVETVKTQTQPVLYEAVGTVEAKTAATISSKVMGEITKIAVHEGDYVKKGDLLLSIEDRQIMAQLNQAKAGLAEARQSAKGAESALDSAAASARLAETTYTRYKSLMASNSVSRQEFDEVDARYQQAQAGLAQAKSMRDAAHDRVAQATAGVAAAESAWRDTVVSAPYDGRVTTKLVKTGDMASPGMPLLKMEETGLLEVYISLPEANITNVHIGDPVSVDIPSAKATVEGTITTIDPAADASSRSFQIKVTLPEVAGLHSGLFARVKFPVGSGGMILIPVACVVHQGQLTGVYLLDKNNIARFRLIRTGRSFADKIEVLSGLKDGDRLVAALDHTIADGVKIDEKQ